MAFADGNLQSSRPEIIAINGLQESLRSDSSDRSCAYTCGHAYTKTSSLRPVMRTANQIMSQREMTSVNHLLTRILLLGLRRSRLAMEPAELLPRQDCR